MSFLRRLIVALRPPRARYGEEVLLAGWVQLPKTIWDLIRRR